MSKNKVNMDVVLVFDTETTGLPKDWKRPSTDIYNWPRVVQLGMALQIQDGTVQTYKTLIKPPNGMAFPIPSEASRVHGITDRMCVADGVSIEEALEFFEFWLSGCDVLVAHNMSFDRPVISCECHRAGKKLTVSKKTRLVCTKEATTEYVGIPNQYPWGDPYKWPTLSELHIHLFGEDFQGAHDALDDVMATLRCFNELRKRGTFVDGEFLPTQHQKR